MKTAEKPLQNFTLETKVLEGRKKMQREESKPEGTRLVVGLDLRGIFQPK